MERKMMGYLRITEFVPRIDRIKMAFFLTILVGTAVIANDVIAQDPGQQYESLVIAPQYIYSEPTGKESVQEKRDLTTKKKDAVKLISDGKSLAQQVLVGTASRNAAFDAYFNDYVFPSMAQATDSTISSVGLLRQDFIKNYLSATYKPGANRSYLIETLTVPMCRRLATGNFHPSVRMNAVYLAGLLNDREGERDVFPATNKAALSLLMELTLSPDSPEYLVASSASALARIAEIESVASNGLDMAPLRGYAASVLTGQATGQAKWQPDTDYWMRKRAIQTLGFLRDTSAIGELNKIASDSVSPMPLRVDAAEALGKIGFAGAGAGQAAAETVISVSHLAADVFAAESRGIRSSIEDLVAVNLLWGNSYLIDPSAGLGVDGNPALPGGRSGEGGAGRIEGGEAGAASAGETSAGGGQEAGRGAGQGAGANTGAGGSKQKIISWKGFNLPNYHINLVRRRSKAYIHICDTVLLKIKQADLVGGNEKTVLTQTLEVLKNAMIDTDIGLRDLSGRADKRNPVAAPFGAKEEEDEEKSTTIKMMEMFDAHAAKVREFLPKPAPVAPQQPASSEGSPVVTAPTGVGTGS